MDGESTTVPIPSYESVTKPVSDKLDEAISSGEVAKYPYTYKAEDDGTVTRTAFGEDTTFIKVDGVWKKVKEPDVSKTPDTPDVDVEPVGKPESPADGDIWKSGDNYVMQVKGREKVLVPDNLSITDAKGIINQKLLDKDVDPELMIPALGKLDLNGSGIDITEDGINNIIDFVDNTEGINREDMFNYTTIKDISSLTGIGNYGVTDYGVIERVSGDAFKGTYTLSSNDGEQYTLINTLRKSVIKDANGDIINEIEVPVWLSFKDREKYLLNNLDKYLKEEYL